MSVSRLLPIGLVLTGAAILCSPSAFAQDAALPAPQPVLPYDLSVVSAETNERLRQEYDQRGIDVAGGRIRPSVEIAGGYTDNVFGTSEGKVSDGFVAMRPELAFQTGDGEEFVSVYGSADLRRYLDYSRADETGLMLDVDSSVPVGSAAVLQSGALARRAYERPSSGSFPLEALTRIEYDEIASYVRFIRSGARVRVLAAADAARFNFKDALPAFGGAPVDQDDRDRVNYRGSGRLEWSVSGAVSTFVEGAYSRLDYRRDLRLDGTDNLDGSRWEAKAGALFTSGKLRGGLGAGYSQRRYESESYTGFSGFTVDASLQYFATGLTTFTLAGRRSIEEGGAAGAGSFIQNYVELRADHELLRNLLLSVAGRYAESDYRQTDRNDTILAASGSARYLLSSHIELTSELGLIDRSSSGAVSGPEFNALYGTLGVTFRY